MKMSENNYKKFIEMSNVYAKKIIEKAGKNIPDIIYHYTSLKSFLSIISNRNLVFTDSGSLNDSKELIYAMDYVIAKIEKIDVFKPFNLYISKCCEEFRRKYKFYLSCMSEDPENLAMWSMYADNAWGVVIGFESNMFGKRSDHNIPYNSKSLLWT